MRKPPKRRQLDAIDECLGQLSRKQRAIVRELLAVACLNQPTRRAMRAAAAAIDMRQWRIVSTFEPGPFGLPERDTLEYRVEIACLDGWAPIASIDWRLLDLDEETRDLEVSYTIQQYAAGETPRWDDPTPPLPPEAVADLN